MLIVNKNFSSHLTGPCERRSSLCTKTRVPSAHSRAYSKQLAIFVSALEYFGLLKFFNNLLDY